MRNRVLGVIGLVAVAIVLLVAVAWPIRHRVPEAEWSPTGSQSKGGGSIARAQHGAEEAVFPGPISLPSEHESSPWRGGSGTPRTG
jgi:hypothetical protein